MQPTIDAELSGARRLLEPLAADRALPVEVTVQLKGVMRTLQRLEESWPRVLPYLVSDNARVTDLLRELAPALSAELRAEIDDVVSSQGPAPDPRALDIAAANQRNELLREILSRAVSARSHDAGEADATVRARAVGCLRESLDERPW